MGRNRFVLALAGLCFVTSVLLVGCGDSTDDSFVRAAGTWDVTFSDGTTAVFKLTQSGNRVVGVASVSGAADAGGTYALTGTYTLAGTVKGNTIVLTAQSARLHPPTFSGIICGHTINGHMVEGYRDGAWSATRRLASRYPKPA
jgi:hypothetical protein